MPRLLCATRPTQYDASGNMTKDDLQRYVFDGEGRLAKLRDLADTQDLAAYTFDGNGLRVQKTAQGATTVYIFSGSKVVAEYASGAAPNAPTREYIYSGSTLLAKIEGSATKYYHQDHLSNRLITDSSGTTLEQKGHFPFGEDWYQGGDKWKFTTYERDSESGNDYALARSYVNRLARFSSPDPLAGDISDPQSLNRYTYSRNDPINLSDPLGMYCEYRSDDDTFVESIDLDSSPEECSNTGGTWVEGADTATLVLAGGSSGSPSGGTSGGTTGAPVGMGGCVAVIQDGIFLGTYCPGGNPGGSPGGNGAQGGRPANNGIDPGALPYQQYLGKRLLVSIPEKVKRGILWYLCGNGEVNNIRNYTLEGTGKGIVFGGIAGGLAGALPGAALGALEGGVEGFFLGSALGGVATGACNAAGMYGPV